MKAMKAAGDAAVTVFRCALAKWSDRQFRFGLSEYCFVLGTQKRASRFCKVLLHTWCPKLACGLSCIGSAGDEES